MDITHPDWLATAMAKKGIQTGELAALSGVSRSQIQRIRKGMQPRLGTLLALHRALKERKAAA